MLVLFVVDIVDGVVVSVLRLLCVVVMCGWVYQVLVFVVCWLVVVAS